MSSLSKLMVAGALAAGLAGAAQAEGAYTKTVTMDFDDAAFAVENAIINEGLVIDLRSHVGEMLARTGADMGAEAELFTAADIFSFCSARVSRAVIEADLTNVQFCPYNIFLYELAANPGEVVIGHRHYPGDSMAPVNEMLNRLVDAAAQ